MQGLIPKGVAATVPPLYATDDEGPVACVKLFGCVSGWTWCVTDHDPTMGEAFGLVENFADEWGAPSSVRWGR